MLLKSELARGHLKDVDVEWLNERVILYVRLSKTIISTKLINRKFLTLHITPTSGSFCRLKSYITSGFCQKLPSLFLNVLVVLADTTQLSNILTILQRNQLF